MSFYLVVYTAAHLVGAVSTPIDLDWCASREDDWRDRDPRYTFVCEEHDKPPKVQVKIPAEDRRFYSGNCVSNGLSCEDLPNGRRVYPGYHCETIYVAGTDNTPHPKIVKSTCKGLATARKRLRKLK